MIDSSLYRVVSIGLVAENKKRGTSLVKVTPLEVVPVQPDELTTATAKRESKGIRQVGLNEESERPYSVGVTVSATMEVEWIGQEFRTTAPDVRRGEQVVIYQFGDSDKYYWDTTGRSKELRRLETIVWAVNANPNNGNDKPSPKDHYYLEVSSHDKHITLQTAKKNGEKAAYTFQFNLRDGQVTLEDDIGNEFFMDSVNHHLVLKNADGTIIELDKETINTISKIMNLQNETMSIKMQQMTIQGDTLEVDAVTTFKKPVTFEAGFNSAGGGGKVSGGMETDTMQSKSIDVDHISWKSKSGPEES